MAFAILVSMLVSFTLTPMLSSRMLKPGGEGAGGHGSKESRLWSRIDGHYGRLLGWSLANRGTVMAVAALPFLLTFPLNAMVGRDWIPTDDLDVLTVIFNLP